MGVSFSARGVLRGAVEAAPLAAFVVPFGIAFGAAATANAMAPEISLAMSVTMFAGVSQFAILGLWHAPLPLAMLALTVFAVNARHILLGATLGPWLLQVSLLQRIAALAFMTDANFALTMSARQRGEADVGMLLGSGLATWIGWIFGTLIGSMGGALLGDVSRVGIDAVMLVYFVAVIVGQWKSQLDWVPWICAGLAALIASRLLPPGWHTIVGAVAGGIAGAWQNDR